MHATSRATLHRIRAATAPLLLAVVVTGCELGALTTLGPDGAVSGVLISLEFAGGASSGFLTVGDRDTIRAQAYGGVWPSYTKYDSQTEPRRFIYHSTDPRVAIVDADGIVVATGPGTTVLTATCEGIESYPLELTVSPHATELRVTPASFDVVVGDTIVVAVSAFDEQGAEVSGVVFSIGPDTSSWAVVNPPVESEWKLGTPKVLHLTARQAGRVRLLAHTMNEREKAWVRAQPVLVIVREGFPSGNP